MSNTAAMRVGSTTFLVERIAADCAPLQWVRELTQNSFEAIMRHRESGWSGEGLIEWDVDWSLVEKSGIYKLQITDNGCGMTGEEIEEYINRLSSSGGIQSDEKNYGIGAKITAGVQNPIGLTYKSWKNGAGVIATLWKDFEEGIYGLKKIQIGDNFGSFAPLNDEAKNKNVIQDHGTSVVLQGNSIEENTYYDSSRKQKWLISYLNSRYYELPKNITLKVRDFSNSEPEQWPKNFEAASRMGTGGSQMRTIYGMKYYLEKYAEKYGIVDLDTVKIHWFILPEDLNVSGGVWDEKYHCAAIYQSELYDLKRASEARSILINFGITWGWNRIVLYAEPNLKKIPVITDISRKSLQTNGLSLPWEDWAEEFRIKMPEEIKLLMDEILSKTSNEDFSENIEKRLKELNNIFKIDRFRFTKSGKLKVAGDLPGDTPNAEGDESSHEHGGKKGNRKAKNDLFAAFINEEGQTGEKQKGENKLPKVVWVSALNGTRAENDLEDRAARYVARDNLITANADFRYFEAYIEALKLDYPHAGVDHIKSVLHEWVEMQLIESVMGIQSLQGSPTWSDANTLEDALSELALTTAVMPRYATYSQIKRNLSQRVGASPS